MKTLILLSAIFLFSVSGFAKPIKVEPISNLDFGTGAPGDSSKQISPGTSETSTNASFQVTGDNNRAFTILLPTDATLETGNGPNKDTIAVSSFLSFPSGASALDATGQRMVFVGATRSSLKLSQRAGLYSGSYSITVVY